MIPDDQALFDEGLPVRRAVLGEVTMAFQRAAARCGIPAGPDAPKAAHEVLVEEGAPLAPGER